MKNYTYKYPRPAVTADCVVITKDEDPKVLLIKRKNDPYKDCWAIPGGFLNMDETLMQCAYRELQEETGITAKTIVDIQEIGSYSQIDRDPRGRTITAAFLAIIEHVVNVKGQDDATQAKWFPIDELPPLAFDHEDIIADAFDMYCEMTADDHFEIPVNKEDKIDKLVEEMAIGLRKGEKKLGDLSYFDMAVAVSQLYSFLCMYTAEHTEMDIDGTIKFFLTTLKASFEKSSIRKLIDVNEQIVKQIQESMQKNLQKLKENEQKLAKIHREKSLDKDAN